MSVAVLDSFALTQVTFCGFCTKLIGYIVGRHIVNEPNYVNEEKIMLQYEKDKLDPMTIAVYHTGIFW